MVKAHQVGHVLIAQTWLCNKALNHHTSLNSEGSPVPQPQCEEQEARYPSGSTEGGEGSPAVTASIAMMGRGGRKTRFHPASAWRTPTQAKTTTVLR